MGYEKFKEAHRLTDGEMKDIYEFSIFTSIARFLRLRGFKQKQMRKVIADIYRDMKDAKGIY